MKKVLAFLAAIILISSLTACNLSDEDPENVLNRLDGIVGLIGNSQITSDESLVGVRNNTEDSYTGEYISKCNGQTGRDVIFGGGTIQKRSLRIRRRICQKSGKATIRIRMNTVVTELKTDEKGNFETILDMTSGGNYIMIDYKNFSGSVELISEYCSGSIQEI